MAGLFGILGLLTEYKDSTTHNVTKWGYFSLAGILISTFFGVIAQFIEVNDNISAAAKAEQRAELTLRETETAAVKTSVAAEQLRKLNSPLSGVYLDVQIAMECDSSGDYKRFCSRIIDATNDVHSIENVISSGVHGAFQPKDLFLLFNNYSGLAMRQSGQFSVVSFGQDVINGDGVINIQFSVPLEYDQDKSGVRSFLDLEKSTVLLVLNPAISTGAHPIFIQLSNSTGDRLSLVGGIKFLGRDATGSGHYTFKLGTSYLDRKLGAPTDFDLP